jgi:hypothetical protein
VDNFSRNLTYALLGSLGALPLGCVGGGIILGVWSYLLPGGMAGFWPNLGLGAFVGLVAILIGILPTLLYGAPAYAFVASRYKPSLLASLAIGALPGLILLAFSSDWATLFLLFGLPVAICLHILTSRRIARHGSNNSFKPTPLRGAA